MDTVQTYQRGLALISEDNMLCTERYDELSFPQLKSNQIKQNKRDTDHLRQTYREKHELFKSDTIKVSWKSWDSSCGRAGFGWANVGKASDGRGNCVNKGSERRRQKSIQERIQCAHKRVGTEWLRRSRRRTKAGGRGGRPSKPH